MPQLTFGQRLTWAQTSAGLTNVQLAERLGVHKVTVSQWRRDQFRPDRDTCRRLASILEVELRWLEYGEGAAPPRPDVLNHYETEPATRDYVDGMIVAIEAMQETLAELLRLALAARRPGEPPREEGRGTPAEAGERGPERQGGGLPGP